MYVENRTKIANFDTPLVFNAPADGVLLGIRLRRKGPECVCVGAFRMSTKFSHTFTRFDSIPSVTDSKPDSQARCRCYYAQR